MNYYCVRLARTKEFISMLCFGAACEETFEAWLLNRILCSCEVERGS